jgi:hypothetical protein
MSAGPAEPVPVAFVGRTSTLVMQDPVASMRRQVRESRAKLPPGFFISRYFWDIESGGLALDQRGHGSAHEQFTDIGIPRDGGLADLLAEAAGPAPGFAAVICEDIERSGRDTYYALQLEKELTLAGIPLFASDEPIDVAGANATTVLVRRVKQGVAEWFRLQIKEKAWRGLREHSLAGWNIGAPPYGYLAHRVPHPVPMKASQGRTKTRLVIDPGRAPAVAAIFTWRTEDKLGAYAITQRLAADPGRYPPPGKAGRWTEASVYAILGNPKYPGYIVFGRQRTLRSGRRVAVPPGEWLWSPEPTHPAIISRATFDAAQAIGAEHSTSRDGTGPNPHPATRRSYILRSRVRCRSCQRRMSGITRTSPRYWAEGPDYSSTYYACHHDPANPRHTAREGHPAPSRSAKTTCSPSSASSSLSGSSAPTAPPCSPPTCPTPPPTTRPAATPKPPPSPSASGRSTPPRTPTPARSKPSPTTTTTPAPRPSQRCAPASWPASPSSRPSGPRSPPS